MPVSITTPKPGDIITAQFMQDLITQLSALDTRLTKVELIIPGSKGELVITDISPVLPQPGGEIRISGVNFETSSGKTLVTFDGASPRTAPFKSGSNERLLVVDLPVFSMAGATTSVVVAVSNGSGGFDYRTITVAKAVETVSTGTLVVSQVAWPVIANNIIPPTGGVFIFPFKAELVAATLDETYKVEVSLPIGWSWTLSADADGLVERPKQIFMAKPPSSGPSLITPLYIKVTVPNINAANGTGNINVTLRAAHNSTYFGTSGGIDIPVGTPLPGLGTIYFTLPPTLLGPGARSNGAEQSFTVPTPVGTADQITVRAKNLKVLDYRVDISWKNGASNGWAATLGGDPFHPITTSGFGQTQAGDADVHIALVAATGATAATLQISIKATAQPTVEFGSLELVVKSA
jgi:hypothetical protein